MADVCGPFTLDELDVFGGIDQINITLDSPIYQSADTCVLASDASVSGVGTASATGNGIFAFVASVTGQGTVSGSAIRIRLSTGSVTGTGSASLDAIRERLSSAIANGVGSATALGGVVYDAQASITGTGTAEAFAWAIYDSSGNIIGIGMSSASGEILGEEWADVPIGAEQWTFRGDGVCGPFTLDQLDIFGGVDTLPYSLDDVIYLRSDFCADAEVWADVGQGANTWLQKG